MCNSKITRFEFSLKDVVGLILDRTDIRTRNSEANVLSFVPALWRVVHPELRPTE
jgi:hypothetical protein